ncbi:PREDICTED: coiled-coil domain-containing protein 178-like [Priapulus caudatus]|uniref:Coiled-coil domain-containing protein 178-like n=1 Tax=Priapulus caudatus TaxID=37621 RepID=A0ABM1E1R8_PRICU|nr:PREDICTED: coiled-coil domain-containing protein 178-like [Priapulus caudatus]
MTASDTQGEGRQCARFTTSVNHGHCGSKPTLSVEGVGADTNASPVNMSAILSSVMKLVKRLKTDKEVTAKLLSTEREKSYVLEKKVSQFSAQRLNVLPEAAEKVHRTRVMDIMELEWHTSYQKRIEAQIKPKVTRAEKLNTRLKADIAFVNKHCPLIEGKLKLQEEDMQKIDEAQEQATQELNDVLLSYGAAEEHSSQEHEKGESERLSISKKLRDANRKLKNVCAELQYCQDLHASYIQQAEESRVKIKTTAADLQEKLDTDTRLDEDESAIAASVKALDKKRKFQEKDISGLQLQIKLLGEERDKQIAAWKSALTDMQNTVHQTASKLRAIVNSSKVHQITTDDTLENISEMYLYLIMISQISW